MNSSQKIIIAVIDRKIEGTNIRKIISHGMFYSTSGKYLNPNELCENEKITFVENVEDKLISSGIKLEVYKPIKGLIYLIYQVLFIMMFAINMIQTNILL